VKRVKSQKAVTLLRPGTPTPGGIWANVGCGDGIFTCALYALIQSGGAIYAVDRDQYALDALVRGSDLEEGESQGLLAWSRHVGDPVLQSNMTRRVDYALFMVAALKNDELIHEAPAIVGCRTPSALAHAAEPDRYAQRVN